MRTGVRKTGIHIKRGTGNMGNRKDGDMRGGGKKMGKNINETTLKTHHKQQSGDCAGRKGENR